MYAVRLYKIQDFGHKKNLPIGPIHILRKHWSGWVGDFRIWPFLLTNSTKIVGGVRKSPKHAHVIFEWSHFHQSLRRPVTVYF